MNDAPLRFGPVELRPQERRLLVDGQVQALGARAFDLLLALAERRERVVTKSELLDLVWPGVVVEESNLPVHVSALRKALGTAAIATIPGRGYRFTLAQDKGAGAAVDAPAIVNARAEAPAPSPVPAGRFDQALETEPLIGREEAVYDIVATLLDHRLVSVVGAGGIGKTRLARAVHRRLREDFVDGVWWVDLAPVQQGDHVWRAVAQSLGEPFVAGADAAASAAALAHSLAHRQRMLLVLDNCEQVSAGVVQVVRAMLDELPMLRLLLTSRVPLHLAAEQVWRLDALPVPEVGDTLQAARACGAFELFERRARASDQRFVLDAAQLPAAIALCRRLEGHPLAIEMAAARAPQLGLAPLLGRLGDRLRLLRASDPAQPGRQLNLRALLDWSCSQLDDVQRAVLRRLSVFAGSFGLETAQQVVATAGLDEWDALDALAVLVDHSLVQAQSPSVQARPSRNDAELPRYRLPETTRLYALEQLDAADEARQTHDRLRQAMARLADEAADAWWTMTQADWLARFDADQADFQATFDTACAHRDAMLAARTGQALAALDVARASAVGASERAGAARALLDLATESRTRGLLWNLAAPAWSLEQATEVTPDEAAARVEAWQVDGDARQLYLARCDQVLALARAERHQDARVAASAMSALEDPAWSPALRCEGAQVFAHLAWPDATDTGYSGLLRGLDGATKMGDDRRVAWMRWQLAASATAVGTAEEAVRLGRQAVSALEPLHRPIALGCAWGNLCAALLLIGDDQAARLAAAEAWSLLEPTPRGSALLTHLALIEARAGNTERAGRLLAGAGAALRSPVNWDGRAILARLRHLALDQIGPEHRLPAEAVLDGAQMVELAWAALGGREPFESRW